MKSYDEALDFASEYSPSLVDGPGKFIAWAEDIANLLSYIYTESYDKVTEDLYVACKNYQDYEDSEESED